MITGPSIGPAMVLNILMRWPALIVVCATGGTGTIVYKNVPEAQAAVQAVIGNEKPITTSAVGSTGSITITPKHLLKTTANEPKTSR